MNEKHPDRVFATGAKRSHRCAFDTEGYPARYDLCPAEGYRAWAKAMGEGALSKGEGNWLLGIPRTELINRVEAHMQALKAGDRTEDHIGHAMANLGMLAFFEARGYPDGA